MTWGVIASTAVSAYMGIRASKAAKKQANKADASQQEEIALQREGLDFSKEQYGDWKEKYDPVFDQMMAEIDSGITPDYAAIAGDVNKSFDTAQDMERRQMQRYGVNPQDGAYSESERDYGIARSTAHSGIRNQARQASAGIKYNRLSGIHGSLQGSQAALAGQVGTGYGRAGIAQGRQTDTYNNRADQAYSRGMDDAAGWGAAIGGIDWGGAYNSIKNWGSGQKAGYGDLPTY